MPRYIVERTFPDGLDIPATPEGAKKTLGVVDAIAECGVSWLHSYVSPAKTFTYCVYEGPSPEAVRKAAECTDLPIDKITEVRVLDPYFHH